MSDTQTLARRIETLEIQLAWQGDLLEALNGTVAALNREVAEQTQRIRALQEALQQQRLDNAAGHEKPPHY